MQSSIRFDSEVRFDSIQKFGSIRFDSEVRFDSVQKFEVRKCNLDPNIKHDQINLSPPYTKAARTLY